MNETTNGHAIASGPTTIESQLVVQIEQHLMTLSDQQQAGQRLINILQEALTLSRLGRSAAVVKAVLAEQMGRELAKAETLGTRRTIVAIRREPGGAVCGSALPNATRDFDC